MECPARAGIVGAPQAPQYRCRARQMESARA